MSVGRDRSHQELCKLVNSLVSFPVKLILRIADIGFRPRSRPTLECATPAGAFKGQPTLAVVGDDRLAKLFAEAVVIWYPDIFADG